MIEIALYWSAEADPPSYLRDTLPESVNAPALPPEGTLIDLFSGDETGAWIFSVEVDYLVLDAASDPANPRYKAFVDHA
ncbi:hypothetical protein A6A27_31925 [Micromonospora sp. CB01531]|nr:hypothetical protein A6A27_31925 [Micromonospora sp. CB01531]